MKTRLNKRREVYKNPFGGKKKRHRARRFNVKHVSGAQLTGTRADAEKRCQAASWISGWFAPPGKSYPGAASSLAARAALSFPLRRQAPSPAHGARPAKPRNRAVRRGRRARRATLRWRSSLPRRAALARFRIALSEEPLAVCRCGNSEWVPRPQTISIPPPSPRGASRGVTETLWCC